MNATTRRLAVWAGILAAWWLVARSGLLPRTFVADPLETARALAAGGLFWDAAATAARALGGVAVAFALAVPAGLVAGSVPAVHDALRGPADLLRSIPPVLLFPLALLGLGPGEGARLLVIAAGAGTVLYLHASRGARTAPAEQIEPLRALGATRWQLLRWVVAPGASPHLAAGARVAVSIGLVIAVVTEMLVGARAGLGARAVEAQLAYRTAELFAILVLTGALGVGANAALTGAERRLVRWVRPEGGGPET